MKETIKKQINLYVLNEHNEAFYFWSKEVTQKSLKNITLLHVDAHFDLSVPHRLNKSVLFDMRAIRKCSKNFLNIENFIIPSLFTARIKKIINVMPDDYFQQSSNIFYFLSNFFDRKHIQFYFENVYHLIKNSLYLKKDIKHIPFILNVIPSKNIPDLKKI